MLNFAALDAYEWSDNPMWVFDLHGRRMVWANQAGLRFWGAASLPEFLGRRFDDLSEAAYTRNEAMMSEHASGRTVREQWTVYPRQKPVTANSHSTGILLPDGRPAILFEAQPILNGIDPMALRGVEAMQHTSVLVMLHRLDGQAVMRNPAAVRAFGPVSGSPQSADLAALFCAPADADKIIQSVTAGRNFSAELQLATRAGPIWFGVDARPVTDPIDGGPLIQINARDISAIRAAQAEMQRAKEAADAANRSKSTFLAHMSHEIRTPMNAIVGSSYLLRTTPLDSYQTKLLDQINRAAHLLLAIINDILDISKIEAGKLSLQNETFHTETIFQHATALLLNQVAAKDVEIIADLADLPDLLTGDPTYLSQALLNYVSNAAKFTQHGEILLRATMTEADAGTALFRFSVTDSGCGIQAEDLTRIFRPYERTEGSNTRSVAGTGLGLAITQELARLMGGDAWVESEFGKGSCFSFTARLAIPAQPPQPPCLGAGEVILFDPNPRARAAIGAMLKKCGATVHEAADLPQLALLCDRLKARSPLHVLAAWSPLDHAQDGFYQSLAARLPAGTRLSLTCVQENEALRCRARQIGARGLFQKPLLPSALNQILTPDSCTSGNVCAVDAATDPAAQLRQRHAGKRLLLVEDNEINQTISMALLAKAGIEADVATNGQEAVDRARVTPYPLVLMDIAMPVMDGLSATRAIRQLPGWQAVPIIAMTADVFSEQREQCLAAGMNAHLAKPVEPDTLYRNLLQWLDGGTVSPPLTAPQDHTQPPPAAPPSPIAATHAIDLAAGLENTAQSRPLYKQLAQIFLEAHAADADTAQDLLRNHQWREARRIAHTMRSVAATLGGEALALASEQLESAIVIAEKSSEPGPPAELPELAEFATALRLCIDALTQILPEL